MSAQRSRKTIAIATAVLTLVVGSGAAHAAEAEAAPGPSVVDLTWLPRSGTDSDPILRFRLTVDAPDGLSGGEVRLGSVFHEILATEPIEPTGAGTNALDFELPAPGDKLRPWEVIGVTLLGADGSTTSYGFCDLVPLVETREDPRTDRLSVDCLDGPGWVVYTFRAEPGATGTIWSRGVATRDGTYAGTGHVLQDDAGAVVRWGTSTTVVYPGKRDGTQISYGGNTVIDEPSPDPSATPGPHRIVVGVGGSTPPLEPGATYRWGAYYAIRPGHFDLPFISIEGSGITILSVETGTTAGIAWGSDFKPSVVVERSATDSAVVAGGELGRSFSTTTTCMFLFHGGRLGGVFSLGLGRIEGPGAPTLGGVVVAGRPGDYRFQALAGVGQSSGRFVVGYADMPLTPQAPAG